MCSLFDLFSHFSLFLHSWDYSFVFIIPVYLLCGLISHNSWFCSVSHYLGFTVLKLTYHGLPSYRVISQYLVYEA